MKTKINLISTLVALAMLVSQSSVMAKTEADIIAESKACEGKSFVEKVVAGKTVQIACTVTFAKSIQTYNPGKPLFDPKSPKAKGEAHEPWTVHEHAFFNNSVEDENFYKKLFIRRFRVYLQEDVLKNTEESKIVCAKPPEKSTECTGEDLSNTEINFGGVRVKKEVSNNPAYPKMITWEFGAANSEGADKWMKLPQLQGANPTLDTYLCNQGKKDWCPGGTNESTKIMSRGFSTFEADILKSTNLLQMFSKDLKQITPWTATTHSQIEIAYAVYPKKPAAGMKFGPDVVAPDVQPWKFVLPIEEETQKYTGQKATGETKWKWRDIGTDVTVWERTDLPVANFCKQLNVTATAAEVNKPISFTVAPVTQGQGNAADLRFSWTATLGSALVGSFDGGLNPYNTEKKTAVYSGGPSETKIKVSTTDVFGNIYPGCVWETTLKTKDVPPPEDDICAYITVTPSGVLNINNQKNVTINVVAAKNAKGGDFVGSFSYTDTSSKGTFTDLTTNVKSPFKLITKNKQVSYEGAVDGTTILIEALNTNVASCKAKIEFKQPTVPPTDCTKTPNHPDCIKNQISDLNIEKRVEGEKFLNISANKPGQKKEIKYQVLYTPVHKTSVSYTEITDDLWQKKEIKGSLGGKVKLVTSKPLIAVRLIEKPGAPQVAALKKCVGKTPIAPCYVDKISTDGGVIVYGAQDKILFTYFGELDSKVTPDSCKTLPAANGCGEEFINVARYTAWQNPAKLAPFVTGQSLAKVIVVCPYILARAGGDVLFHSPLDTKLIDISQCSNVKTTDDVVIKPKKKKPELNKTGAGTAGFDATHKICERSNISGQNEKDQPIDYQNPLENISSLLCEFQVELEEKLQQESIETSIKESRLRVARWSTTTQKAYNGSIPQGQNVFRVKGNLSIGNITNASFGTPDKIRPVTFIAEDGDIFITGNIDTTQNQKSNVFTSKQGTIALIALNGNIIIQNHVDTVSAVLFAQKDTGTSKGRITGGGGTSHNILTIIGSVYGDIEDIVKARQPLGKILSLGKDQSAFTVRYDERIFFNTPPVLQDLVNISQTEVAR